MVTRSRRETAKAVGRYVSDKTRSLSREYTSPTGSSPRSRARIALLRRDLDGRAPSWMLVGEELFSGWPTEALGDPRDNSPELNAVRASLGLFAVHQQSLRQPMEEEAVRQRNDDGKKDPGSRRMRTSMGRACGLCVGDLDHANGVRRRLRMAEEAMDFPSLIRSLRALVVLLRQADGGPVPLSYRRLAEDLYLLQFPSSRSGVFQQWGKDFFTAASPKKATVA